MTILDDLVDKYMRVLSIDGAKPIVEVKTRIGANWLGRDRWSSRRPHTTTMELQRSIVGDPMTLERVVAHEMVHHRDMLALTPEEIELTKLGIKPPAHGPSFRQGAAIINALMGPEFVTELSDQEYVQAPPERDLYLLIVPLRGDGRLGFAWAARLSSEAVSVVAERVLEGGKLVRTRDRRWTNSRAKISTLKLPTLIELKLASAMTAPDRLGDFADVIRLIQANRLSRSFRKNLNPWVRGAYDEMWERASHKSGD